MYRISGTVDDMSYNDYLQSHAEKQNRGAYVTSQFGTRYKTSDSERKKTYESEWSMENRMGKKIKSFSSLKEAQLFAQKIYGSQTWQKLWKDSPKNELTSLAQRPTIVAKQRSTGRGTTGWTDGTTVTLDSVVGFNRYVLVHELTHCLGHMHHGRSFRKALLSMVGTFIGSEARLVLKEEFKKRKLQSGQSRKPMEFDKWIAAKERMKHMRELKNS